METTEEKVDCQKKFDKQHCAFKLRWILIYLGFLVASVALLLKINIQWHWIVVYLGATGIGGAIDMSLYKIKKNGEK
jgi:Na+-translocating ferredoxin:NAD+ oxidoreductase RnfD subunit